jgi:hypothetical protein
LRNRSYPVIILAALVVLVVALTLLNVMSAPPEINPVAGMAQDHAGHSHGAPQTEPPKQQPRSAEEIAKEIEATTKKTPGAPAAPKQTIIEVSDRDDEGSSQWWDDTPSPDKDKR